MKRNLKLVTGAISAYIVIVVLLTLVESGADGSSIRTIWDAIWYSVITLTTVGYGDLSPVTGTGRVLGIILALCSLGVLSAVISISFRIIGEQFLPMAKLYRNRDKHWYVFGSMNRDSLTLAQELGKEKNSVLIFRGEDTGDPGVPDNVIYTEADPAALKEIKEGDGGITAVFMGEDPWENYCGGLAAAEKSIECYCMADMMVDTVPDNMHLFGKAECLGRWYWQYYPLLAREKTVVLIGCGKFGSALLERALLTNVYTPDRTVEYHVFEDEAGFADMHGELVRALNAGDPQEDRLIFYKEKWHEKMDLLKRADRIIICRDDDSRNLDILEKLSTWFGIRKSVHVRLSEEMPGVQSFGTGDQILKREYVMKDSLNRQAVTMNEIYNRGSANPTKWEDLSYFLKQSNIAAADHLLVKIRHLLGDETITEITPGNCRRAYEAYCSSRDSRGEEYQEMEHRRWMHFYLMHNWCRSKTRDNEKRLHPLMRPYAELDAAEQRKDAYAWEMLGLIFEES